MTPQDHRPSTSDVRQANILDGGPGQTESTAEEAIPIHDFASLLADAKSRLLDLTFRNRLLKYTPTKSKHLDLDEDDPISLFRWLVEYSRICTFEAGRVRQEAGPRKDGPWWRLEPAVDEERKRIRKLVVPAEVDALETKLRTLSKEAVTVIEEQGYNALFLALGFLRWQDKDHGDEWIRAPLVLVPVRLARRSVADRFDLTWDEEDPFYNLSLWERLKEQGIELPKPQEDGEANTFDSSQRLADWHQEIATRIRTREGWTLEPGASLGFFSFTKFIMFKDLDAIASGAVEGDFTQLLRHLIAPQDSSKGLSILDGDGSAPFDEDRLDELLDWSSAHYVDDADPSQIAAIQDVVAGKSIIIEGPPGTGKSQTITNLIGDLLSKGKRVLFVSEKKAALDVVKDRLDRVGIGDFCLPLHSNKTTKGRFYEQLRQSFQAAASYSNPPAYSAKLDSNRNKLNEYANAIATPLFEGGPTPVQIMGRIVSLRERYQGDVPTLKMPASVAVDPTGIARCYELGERYSAIRESIPPNTVAWRGTDPLDLNFTEQTELRRQLPEASSALADVLERFGKISAEYPIKEPVTETDWALCRDALLHLERRPTLRLELLTNDLTDRALTEVRPALDAIQRFQQGHATLPGEPKEESWRYDVADLQRRYEAASRGLFFLKSSYREAKRQYQWMFVQRVPKKRKKVHQILSRLVQLQRDRQSVDQRTKPAQYLFGPAWAGTRSDVVVLAQVHAWLAAFRHFYRQGAFRQDLVERLREGLPTGETSGSVQILDASLTTFRNAFSGIEKAVRPDQTQLWGAGGKDAPLGSVFATLEQWVDAIDSLDGWISLRAWCRDASDSPLAGAVEEIEEKLPGAEEFDARLRWTIASLQVDTAWSRHPELKNFNASSHERIIQAFKELDRQHKEWSRAQVRARLQTEIKKYEMANIASSPAGIVKHELQKKRRHLSIRRLLDAAPEVVATLKPCFMMSPLSVAQYLRPGGLVFDVVVFDEASQIKPEDAYGTLLRGRQAVVVGDSMQLPPTTFFDHLDEDAQEDLTFRVGDFESILRLCRAKFPESRVRMLRWHYRSRHESLIAPSNQEFYNNRLNTFPSPAGPELGFGSRFIHVPEGIYDRGRSATNRIEAQRIASDVMAFLEEHGDSKTLGVAAMSVAQQRAIEDALSLRRKEDQRFENHFNPDKPEYVFIKNLETIQGDERDVIFVSIGYGRDDAGKIHTNFGPVNRQGGERRLNVLFTRARERVHIYANFRAGELPRAENEGRGIQVLRLFLETAETGKVPKSITSRSDTDSPFEDSVRAFLVAQGYSVEQQVGVSGYRIDLAVHHKEFPGAFAIAIECDGATYHSSRVARERDHLRQLVLERLGWRFHRIWSTDWIKRPAHAKEALLKEIEDAMAQNPLKVSNPAPTTTRSAEDGLGDEHALNEFKIESASAQHLFDDYIETEDIDVRFEDPFDQTPLSRVVQAVQYVVHKEGPVHQDVVVDRLRRAGGFGRAGARIQNHIQSAIAQAASKGAIRRDKQGFLWRADQESVEPRVRNDAASWKAKLIPPAEIEAAGRRLLEINGSCPPDALAREALRALGFNRISKENLRVATRIIKKAGITEST